MLYQLVAWLTSTPICSENVFSLLNFKENCMLPIVPWEFAVLAIIVILCLTLGRKRV